MALSILYALLAILGLGFLVFVHELGHYWVARRKGMRVEAFSIGFGKPLYSWERKGVRWQIGSLPFGGYVKIAGMQKEGSREPYEIPDGFYGKRPWERIQVAFAGPLVNLVFSFAIFGLLCLSGGREKQFAEFTHHIGWVDPHSPLYAKGVRPGDVILQYGDRSFHGFKDLLVTSLMDKEQTHIVGYKIDDATGLQSEFDYTLKNYDDPRSAKERFQTIGVLSPAQYLLFQKGALPAGSPLEKSGIQPNDRILWADGEVLFSVQQLSALINESMAFVTVQRGDALFQTKVPRIRFSELKMSPIERGEIDDWQHEAKLKGRLQDLYFIPYNLSPSCVVEGKLPFIDEEDQARAFQKCERCTYFTPLEEGDLLLAVEGIPVHSSYQLLQELQTRRVLVIVDRSPALAQRVLWTQADAEFDHFDREALNQIVSSIGLPTEVRTSGPLHLLSLITPKPFIDLPLSEGQKTQLAQEMARTKKEIEAIQDARLRSEELQRWEKERQRLVLGLPLKDRQVVYNPSPLRQFGDVFDDTWRTLAGLFSGYLNPKYVSGPVGIVQIVHQSWMIGIKEALYWMAVISLNLGLINLLPLPVLDGGHILFSAIETVTRRPLRAKTMERLIFPFVGLLVALFIYITYQDIARLLSKFF